MLWYKSWLETRWRFLLGFALLTCSAAATVFTYVDVAKLLPSLRNVTDPQLREAAALASSYRGYVWSTWFRQNLSEWATLFAAVLGTARMFSAGDGALFTLSLPVSRERILRVRALTGLAELLVIVATSCFIVPLFSAAIDQRFAVSATFVHIVCAFIATSVFFCFAFFLSTLFDDPWRPMLIAVVVAIVIAKGERMFRSDYGLFRAMSAEAYFRSQSIPWIVLMIAIALSAALYLAAITSTARRDF